MRQRVEVGKKWLAGEVAPACRIARALLVSRQSLYKPLRVRKPLVKPIPRPVSREVAIDVEISPETLSVEDALVVLARRHVGSGYRQLWSRLRRKGYCVNKKKIQRLLRIWGYSLTRRGLTPSRRAGPSTSPNPTSSGRPT